MRLEKQKWFALIGALAGAAYLLLNRVLPTGAELLLGFLLGVGLVSLVVGQLPEELWRRLRKWKRRGE